MSPIIRADRSSRRLASLVWASALGALTLAGGVGVAHAQEAPAPSVGGPVGGAGGSRATTTRPASSSSPASAREAPAPAGDSSGPNWVLVLVAGGLFGVLIGAGGGFVIGRASKRSGDGSPPAYAPDGRAPFSGGPGPVAPAAPLGPSPTDGERSRLVTAVIDVRDQLDSEALREWLRAALADVGVEEVRADGQPFDPQRHQAVDQVAAAEPGWDHLVARTDRPGYIDRGVVLRLPQVSVYRYGGQP